MHGRKSFDKGIERDIVIVQTERASFSYGSTTRKQIKNKQLVVRIINGEKVFIFDLSSVLRDVLVLLNDTNKI